MFLYIYSLLCFILPCTIYQLINMRNIRLKSNKVRHIIWVYIFLFYCYLAVQDTAGIGTVWDMFSYGGVSGEINFIPFQSEGFLTYILNIIMFMPLGFLLPLIWTEYRNFLKTAMVGLGLSFVIEICQLFNLRHTDIDDLLMNTLGAMLGYVIWYLFHKIFKRAGEKSVSITKGEPIIYLVLGILGIFFLYNWRMFV